MKQKVAFTLAETLITLVIVGIVAAITVPAVMNNINSKQKEEKIKNVYHKLSKSTDKMLGISGLNGYSSTEEFLNAFKNHLSIAKICKSENIQDCWGSKTVKLNNGMEDINWEISKATTTKMLRIPSSQDGYKDVMGFVVNDGTPFIVSYDTKCDMSLSDGKIWSGDKSSSTNCLAGVFDYNGGRKPNKLTDDVKTLNSSAGLGPVCAFKVNGTCYTAPQVATSVTKSECEAMIGGAYGIKKCSDETDYWAGAVKMCGGVNQIISDSDLNQIGSEIYGITINPSNWSYCNDSDTKEICFTSDNQTAQKYQIAPNQWFWSQIEGKRGPAYRRDFFAYGSSYREYGRKYAGGRVLCKAD